MELIKGSVVYEDKRECCNYYNNLTPYHRRIKEDNDQMNKNIALIPRTNCAKVITERKHNQARNHESKYHGRLGYNRGKLNRILGIIIFP